MRMIIGSRIALADAPTELIHGMRGALSLNNPAYWQAKKRNPHAQFFMSPEIKYFEERNGYFFCGRGLEERVTNWCDKYDIECETIDRTSLPFAPWVSTIKLRDYQEGVPEEIVEHEHGVIRLDTGFGKTVVGLKIAELLKTTTLFIVPKKSILGQFAADIEKYFGVKPGILGDGKKTIEPLTVATIQTLQRFLKELPEEQQKQLAQYFGCVIVDECHTTVPEKSRRVIEFFAPRYLYGMTATARRTDEQGEALEFMYGSVIIDRKMDRKTPTVCTVPFTGAIPMGEYHEIIEEQTNDHARNQLIATLVAKEVLAGRKVLVLTKRVAHYDRLLHHIRELAPASADRIIALGSDGSATARAAQLDSLRAGDTDFNCLLGTFSLLSTGVDVPSLDTLVIAGDLKSDVLTEQSAGRILRLFEGKPDPIIYDINDTDNFILKRQARARQVFYKENNWVVEHY